jgi:hypothetical protein
VADYRRLNKQIIDSKQADFITTEEVLKDVEPFFKDQFPLSEFVKQNKDKIDKVTPKNPTIAKDDVWRNE